MLFGFRANKKINFFCDAIQCVLNLLSQHAEDTQSEKCKAFYSKWKIKL
jgi:hypothetical protein